MEPNGMELGYGYDVQKAAWAAETLHYFRYYEWGVPKR